MDCDRITALFNTTHNCCNSSTSWLSIECDSGQRITRLLYDNISLKRRCTLSSTSLSNLTALQTLSLSNYVDETTCPDFSVAFQYLPLTSLAMRGANLSEHTSVKLSRNTLLKLDLSYSNLTTLPGWIDRLDKLDTLLMYGSPLVESQLSFRCHISHMALALRTDNLSWLNSNCTQLTWLNLYLDVPPDRLNLSRLVHLETLTVISSQAFESKFPLWLGHLTMLQHLTYRAKIVDTLPLNVLERLPLTVLDLTGNKLTGELPQQLSAVSLDIVRLQKNMLWGSIPAALMNASICNLGENPILCAGAGNPWGLCHHCGLIPSFLELMEKYKIQLIVLAACLLSLLIGSIWVFLFHKHQRPSFWTFLGVFFCIFGMINLLTTIVHLGYIGHSYISLVLLCLTTIISLCLNAYLYSYCCRRFNILIIRRTWPVFVLCCLDLNNFRLYKISTLNLSAYRTAIDFRVPTALSLFKVILADIPHTAIAIYLLMLHSPVASTLLLSITSGIFVVRAIVQTLCLCYQARQAAEAAKTDSTTSSLTCINETSNRTENERLIHSS
ncbi:hypothetical protein EC973_001295 [Apophysomyces ossiformis]|uniref:Uncharacterized protein n=1 Tax=Apophysomyces ossiformis TaxID=679940 RepID=A0A8H7EPE1_9FUNG|nr:hypothetical protein EC973_001295 [Apophysomyces ossiformis]